MLLWGGVIGAEPCPCCSGVEIVLNTIDGEVMLGIGRQGQPFEDPPPGPQGPDGAVISQLRVAPGGLQGQLDGRTGLARPVSSGLGPPHRVGVPSLHQGEPCCQLTRPGDYLVMPSLLAQTARHHPGRLGRAAVGVLKPVAARGFDPLSGAADDAGDENTDQARFAIDGSPGTAWHTQYYVNNPKFGGLKNGTGLILDMGKPVELSSVTVTLGPVRGADVRIEVGNSGTRSPPTLRTFTTVSRKGGAGGTVHFTARTAAKGRFVLIWFTRLPPQTPGSASLFQAEVFNVTVHGTR